VEGQVIDCQRIATLRARTAGGFQTKPVTARILEVVTGVDAHRPRWGLVHTVRASTLHRMTRIDGPHILTSG